MLLGLIAAVLFCSVIGGFVTPTLRENKPFVYTNWAGTFVGALAPFLLLNLIFVFPFLIDPFYILVQEFLVAGIIGGLVDLPLMVSRNAGVVPIRRTFQEAMAVLAGIAILVVTLVCFLQTYQPVQLPQ
jgi:hypothetical protein